MSHPNILMISGSLRLGSYNRKLLKCAETAFGAAEVATADLNIPLYDGDLEERDGIPNNILMLCEQIKQADGIVISAPEYNKGISGVLKNALDWISRVDGAPLSGKPTVVLSAAAGRTGGETAQYMVMSCLTPLGVHHVPGPMVLVASAYEAFDDTGALKSKQYQTALETRMQALRAAIEAVSR